MSTEVATKNPFGKNVIHGKRYTKIYEVWHSMCKRCANHNSPVYDKYGGRGIAVCDEWKDFLPFYEWAIENGYSEGLTLDRIDNDGNYSPDNCRWTTYHQQNANSRNNTDFAGVSFDKNRNSYAAYLHIGGKQVFYKRFKDKLDAIEARLQAEITFGVVVERNNP